MNSPILTVFCQVSFAKSDENVAIVKNRDGGITSQPHVAWRGTRSLKHLLPGILFCQAPCARFRSREFDDDTQRTGPRRWHLSAPCSSTITTQSTP